MKHHLQDLRDQLDEIDKQLISLLAKRFAVTSKVGEYKRDNHIAPVDEAREALQMERISSLAEQAGLNPDFARKHLRTIIDQVVRDHKALQDGKK